MNRAAGFVISDYAAAPALGSLVFDGGRISGIDTCSGRKPASPCYLVPGFIDSHTHPLELGLPRLFVDLAGTDSMESVLGRLRDYVRARPYTLFAFNLEPDALGERRYPEIRELDAATGAVPAFVYRIDGHSAVTNTAGLGLLRLAPFAKDMDSAVWSLGLLSGTAYEQASRLFRSRLHGDEIAEALRLADEIAVQAGVTSVGALVGNDSLADNDWDLLLTGLQGMRVRAIPYLQTWQADTAVTYGLKQVGGCLLVDGSFGSHTAALNEPYADRPGTTGCSYVPDDLVLGFLRRADSLGLQTAFHAIGDRAVEQVVRCHERLGAKGKSLRHRIEHAELLPSRLIERISALGLALGVQPAFESAWGGPGRMYSRRLGERWRMTNPFHNLLDHGVQLAGGSDAPITSVDPIGGIRAAMHHPNPDQRVSGPEAMRMFTSAAAWALQLDGAIGALKPGMVADFTILTGDPRIDSDCRVVATFCEGTCVYQNDGLRHLLDIS